MVITELYLKDNWKLNEGFKFIALNKGYNELLAHVT